MKGVVLIKLWHRILGYFIPHYGTVYHRIGGEKFIGTLVDDFYHIMQTDPFAKDCLATHAGRNIQGSSEKLKAFLSGWLGGPQLFVEKYGHPRLRMRHFPFIIGESESEQWLYCMKVALEKSQLPQEEQNNLIEAFRGLTKLIKNRD